MMGIGFKILEIVFLEEEAECSDAEDNGVSELDLFAAAAYGCCIKELLVSLLGDLAGARSVSTGDAGESAVTISLRIPKVGA